MYVMGKFIYDIEQAIKYMAILELESIFRRIVG
jgi:hypothetical protein